MHLLVKKKMMHQSTEVYVAIISYKICKGLDRATREFMSRWYPNRWMLRTSRQHSWFVGLVLDKRVRANSKDWWHFETWDNIMIRGLCCWEPRWWNEMRYNIAYVKPFISIYACVYIYMYVRRSHPSILTRLLYNMNLKVKLIKITWNLTFCLKYTRES